MPDLAALTRNAVKVLPEGELERKLRRGPAAAGQARDRPDGARHPHRQRDPAAAHARVPGAGPHRHPDHRRLHRPRRRSLRPLEGAAAALGRADRRQREGATSSRRRASSTPSARSCGSTASGWRRSTSPSILRLTRIDHRLAAARAKRLRAPVRGQPADLGLGVPLPADAGLRLGGDQGRRRARRHRPGVQPARRPRHPARLRRGAAGGADHAADQRAERRREDERLARQLHRRSPSRRPRCTARR